MNTTTVKIGHRIKAKRNELGLSLRVVANRVGLTASFLSKVERNEASPSLDSLQLISQALEVPLFYFLLDTEIESSPVVRRGERRKIQVPEVDGLYELLTPDVDKKMEGVLTTLNPENGLVPIKKYAHTEEFIFVLEGTLEVKLGNQVYTIYGGDSIYFSGPMLQHIQAIGEQNVRYISVVTPPVF
jgi:transcriptional regulator with XRE-family HTH domain